MSKKLTKIIIKNFQSHKDTTLEFDPDGITAFKGATDKGKSSILRAIDLVINNQPTGDAFVSDWVPRTPKGNTPKANTVVELHTEEGYVRREKGKDNLYFIKTNDMEEERELKNFGSGKVPDEVKTFFNFSPINIQKQKDTHFLLNENPSTVAKYISKIMDLEIIDRTEANINAALRSAKKIKDAKSATIITVEEQLAPFNKVESCDATLSRIEKKQSAVDKSENTIKNAETNVEAKKVVTQSITKAQQILSNVDLLSKVKTRFNSFDIEKKSIATLENICAQFKRTSETITKLSIAMNRVDMAVTIAGNFKAFEALIKKAFDLEGHLTKLKLNKAGLEKSKKIFAFNVNRIQNKAKMYGKARIDLTALEESFEKYKRTGLTIKQNTDTLAENRKQYLEIRGDMCPVCQKPWEENHGH